MQNRIKKIGIALLLFVIGSLLVWQSGIVERKTENVIIRNAGVKLAGTLALPRLKDGPFPAVVVVHGSGRVRRSDVQGFVSKLVSEGYAVLTYDKRGVGKSAGIFLNVTIANSEERISELAGDVEAAVRLLLETPNIDKSRIGIIGSSQAGWIMPVAANNVDEIAYFVSISGPAVTVGQEDFYSQLTGDSPGPYDGLSTEEIQDSLALFGGPQGFDPLPELQQLQIPSLWLLGEDDKSVPTYLSVANIGMIDSSGLFDVRVIPNADHNLRDVETGERYEYWSEILEFIGSV